MALPYFHFGFVLSADDVTLIPAQTSSAMSDVTRIDKNFAPTERGKVLNSRCILDGINAQSSNPNTALTTETEAPSELEMCQTQLSEMIHSIKNDWRRYSHFQECYKGLQPLRQPMLSAIEAMPKPRLVNLQ